MRHASFSSLTRTFLSSSSPTVLTPISHTRTSSYPGPVNLIPIPSFDTRTRVLVSARTVTSIPFLLQHPACPPAALFVHTLLLSAYLRVLAPSHSHHGARLRRRSVCAALCLALDAARSFQQVSGALYSSLASHTTSGGASYVKTRCRDCRAAAKCHDRSYAGKSFTLAESRSKGLRSVLQLERTMLYSRSPVKQP